MTIKIKGVFTEDNKNYTIGNMSMFDNIGDDPNFTGVIEIINCSKTIIEQLINCPISESNEFDLEDSIARGDTFVFDFSIYDALEAMKQYR